MIDLRLGDGLDVLADESVDLICTDPPYGARTHAGHDKSVGVGGTRNALDYSYWTADDVAKHVRHWSAICKGWIVVLTSHDLIPSWEIAFGEAGRYAFAPIPYVAIGSRVRLQGDGPSNWTCWIFVARPRHEPYSKWGTLPGAYVLPRGYKETGMFTGGKPIWLMEHLVRDYSRPNDIVCDPCAGSGTTLIAASMQNRHAVGAEINPQTYEIAKKRIAKGYTTDLFGGMP